MSQPSGHPAPTPTPIGPATRRTARYATYIFWLMFIINFLNYLDRWVFTGLSPIIKTHLKLYIFQIGLLPPAFLFVYAFPALPLVFLPDRIARKSIVGIGGAFWSIA